MTQADRLYRRVLMGSAPATILTTKDDGPVQLAQVRITAVEMRDDTPLLYAYGFSSRPQPQAQALLVSIKGDRSDSAIVAVNDQQFRLRNLAEGEVALYTDEGDFIRFRRGSIVEISSQAELRITAPKVTVSGDVVVQGDVVAGTVSLRHHVHTDPQGGNTGPPVP